VKNIVTYMNQSCHKKTNILFITSLLDRMGGAEKNLCGIVLHLKQDKFKPFVLAFKGGYLTDLLAKKEIAVTENGITKLFSKHTLFQAFSLWRFIRKEQIDVVVTYHHDADIFGGSVAKLAGVPKIISSRRDMGFQLQKKHILFYRYCSWLFSHFITVSDAVKNEVMRRERVSAGKITTIYNGLDIELFCLHDPRKRLALQNEFGLSADKITIGMVASFRPIKGQIYLVDALAAMKDWYDKVQVVIVGYNDTDYFREIEYRVKDAGLEDLFVFTGARDNVHELLTLFDVFVISSVNEGFSNAIIEAMAAGLPVVAADSGGNSEAVVHGETGFLFKPCDSGDLAEKLISLIQDNQLIKTMGQNGKKRVVEKFTLKQMIVANETLYNSHI